MKKSPKLTLKKNKQLSREQRILLKQANIVSGRDTIPGNKEASPDSAELFHTNVKESPICSREKCGKAVEKIFCISLDSLTDCVIMDVA